MRLLLILYAKKSKNPFVLGLDKKISQKETNFNKLRIDVKNLLHMIDLSGKTILVVEDEEVNWWLIRDTLEETNANFIWAKFGQQAIDICDSNPNIDLILMDMKLPIMDGFEATARIKEKHPKIPIIAQTAFALNGEQEKCIEAGCDNFVAKPIEFTVLMQKMNTYLSA